MPIIVTGSPSVVTTLAAWEFDPLSEDAANVNLPLQLPDYGVLEFSAPMPQPDVLYASSVDTEGENPASVRFRNRTVSMVVDVFGRAALSALEFKLGKLIREKGTLLYTLPAGEEIVFDVLAVDSFEFPHDVKWDTSELATVTITLTCRPKPRGPSQDLGTASETTAPLLNVLETGVLGSESGQGTLTITNNGSVDWWGALWGLRSRYESTDGATTAALYFEAESRTPLDSAAAAAGPSGATGSGSNTIYHSALTTARRPVMSLQASGGGAHVTHVGSYRVFARVQTPATNTGTVYASFEWGRGGLGKTETNTERELPASLEGFWLFADLGMITIEQAATGTHQWEGRVLARTTAAGSDALYVDWIFLLPVNEVAGQAEGVDRVTSPTSYTAYDVFHQTAGNLAGKSLNAGGTWTFQAGDTDDWTINTTNRTAQRTSTTDTVGPRVVTAGTTNYADLDVQVDVRATAYGGSMQMGLVARAGTIYTDYVEAGYVSGQNGWWVRGYVSGSPAFTVAAYTEPTSPYYGQVFVPDANDWWTLRLRIDAYGALKFWAVPSGSRFGTPTLQTTQSVLATGGALATGKVGLIDTNGSTASTREYDSFWVVSPAARDAGVHAGQTLVVSHDRAVKESAAGGSYETVGSYKGDYLLVPPAGSEGRSLRYAVKPLYAPSGVTGVWIDSRVDDMISGLTVIPRYLNVPEA
jgi:hypothetical protein